MENSTVYFSGFDTEQYGKDYFGELYSSYGTVIRLFLHKTKNYGMVEFEGTRIANLVIKSLNNKPPLFLTMNMAKLRNSDMNGSMQNSFAGNNNFENRPPRRPNASPNTSSLPDEDEIITITQKYYCDEKNQLVEILTEPSTGEVYVPLRYAKNIRIMIKTVTKYKKTLLEEGYTLEEIANLSAVNDDSHVSASLSSTNSERRITRNSNEYDGIQVNVKNEAKSSHSGENEVSHYQPVRRPYYNKINKQNTGQNNTRFNNSTDYFKEKSSTYNTPNKQFNRTENAPPSKQEAVINFKNAPPAKQEAVTNCNAVLSSPPSVDIHTNHVKNVPVKKVIAAKFTKCVTVELPVNEFTLVSVESVVSETVGWVRMVAHEDVVDDMSRLIMQETEAESAKCEPYVGKLVLAKYETILLRAIILAVAPELRIRYIDYGEDATLTMEDIQNISDKLAAIPAYSFCVKLAEQAPFKMQNGLTMKVKPVRKEDDDITVVHVENGIYEEEQTTAPNKHVLDTLHELLISKLEVSHVGLLEMTLKLSPSQYVATFMPFELSEDLTHLQTIMPKVDASFKPKIGEIVSAKNSEGWQRVYLLSINEEKRNYTVAFIDYATIENVDEILPLPEEFLKYPLFSCVCMFDGENQEADSKLNVSMEFQIKSIDNQIICCDLTTNDVSLCEFNVKPWDPRLEIPTSFKAAATPKKIDENKADLGEELKISDGTDVKLIIVRDGFLYLRTKQSTGILKKVNEYMSTKGACGPTLQKVPQVGQWVAAKYDNGWFRATIISVNGKQASVWFLDYGDDASFPYFTLRKLDTEMTQQPPSLIKIQLKNFQDCPFDQKCMAYFAELNNEFLKASVCGQYFELTRRNGAKISEELMQIIKTKTAPTNPPIKRTTATSMPVTEARGGIKVPDPNAPKFFGRNILGHELPIGRTQILLQDVKDASTGLICVCTNQPDILHRVQVDLLKEITHYATKVAPAEAYVPEMDECVLVENEGKWYRGVCASEENKLYTIFLLDYACAVDVPANKLKRIPKEFVEDKALSMFALVHGLPDVPSNAVLQRLESLLQKNECYTVEVLQNNEEEEFYVISFPDISRILKDEKLIN